MGSPAFKARNAHLRDLGISTNAQVESRFAYQRVTAGDARFRVVRGLFADLLSAAEYRERPVE